MSLSSGISKVCPRGTAHIKSVAPTLETWLVSAQAVSAATSLLSDPLYHLTWPSTIREKTAVCSAKVKEGRYTGVVGKSRVMVVCMLTIIIINNN